MSGTYERLIDNCIQYLQELKSRGVRFVTISPDMIESLGHSSLNALPSLPTPQPSVSLATVAAPATSQSPPPVNAGAPRSLRNDASVAFGPEPAANIDRHKATAELRERALACVKCPHLVSSRRNVVFGVGDLQAQVMFVGEAPGMDEDAMGEPFVGKAGELLTRIIETMGLSRSTVYIANILKCRPDTPGQTAGNRKPTPEEMRTCIPYLHAQIEIIQPKVMVALGATAVEGLLGKTVGITRLRGQWRTYRGIPLMPTYHPAYLLRNQSALEKRRVWEDMLQVMQKLGLPVSEKQRAYFQRGA
jgi:DNA polymerase